MKFLNHGIKREKSIVIISLCSAVMLLPMVLGIDGIWLSSVAAEMMSVAVTIIFIVAKRKKYGY